MTPPSRAALTCFLTLLLVGMFSAGVAPSAQAQTMTPLTPSADLTTAGVGYGIDLGDYDNDGDLDVFWGVPGADKKLLRNDGAGGLSLQFNFPLGAANEGTEGASVADFDGDGWVDVVFVNGDLRTGFFACPCTPNRVFINNQNGTFTEQWTDGDINPSQGVATGDFDGDGLMDYAVANKGGAGSSKVWLNNGNPVGAGFGFVPAAVPAIAAEGVAAGDVDGNGTTDVVFSNGTILLSNGAGGFTIANVPVPVYTEYVAIAQLDGTNGVDLIFSGDRTGQVRVYLEDGAGGYVAQAVVGNTTDVRFDAKLADIDNDGDQDLVVVGFGAGFDSAFLNNGAGQMTAAGGLGWGGKGLGIGDLDGDGDDDVITADPNSVFRNDAASPLEVTSSGDSGANTLRGAIDYANATPGVDTITFNLSSPYRISPTSALPVITDPVIIDGYSQPGSSANTGSTFQADDAVRLVEVEGSAAGMSAYGFEVAGSPGTRISGLEIFDFGGAGVVLRTNGHAVSGNWIQGNGHDAGAGIWRDGVLTEGDNSLIGGPLPGDRNIIIGNNGSGVGAPSNDIIVIQGNFIGVHADGSAVDPNLIGISTYDSADGLVADNVISGNSWYGMELAGVGGAGSRINDFVISGNRIGTGADGVVDRGNGLAGLFVQKGATQNLVEDNLIAFNGQAGIEITQGDGDTPPQQIQMRRNETRDNDGGLGIDLRDPNPSPLGITPNDAGDLDAGPNGYLNFPVIDSAQLVDGAHLRVIYEIDTDLSSAVSVEFFVDGVYLDTPGMPASYFRPGIRIALFPGAENLGAYVGGVLTATATDNLGNTSEISALATIAAAPVLAEFSDEFDDGEISTNSAGIGNGFLSVGQGAVTEGGGDAIFAPSSHATYMIEGRDSFDPFTGSESSVTWEIADLGVTPLPDAGNRTWVGIRPTVPPGGTQESFLPAFGTGGDGIYISINNNPADTQLPNSVGYGAIVSRFPGAGRAVLAEFNWSTWNGTTPLTVTLTTEGSLYTVAFSESVTLLAGSLSGTLPNAPAAGTSYVAGVHFQGAGNTMRMGAIQLGSLSSPLIVRNTNDSGTGSLRSAILFANSNPGLDTITFAIPGDGVKVISPLTTLPAISGTTHVNGLSQSDTGGSATCGDQDFVGRRLLIAIDGSAAPAAGFLMGGGIWFQGAGAANSIVEGLEIRNGNDYGIHVDYADDVTVRCNNVGHSPSGTFGNVKQGVFVDGSRRAIIGGPGGLGNVIAGNGTYELNLRYRGDHTVEGNYIGASPLSGAPAVVLSNLGIANQDLQTVVVEGSGVTFVNNVIGGPSELVQIQADLAPAGGQPRDEPSVLRGNAIGTDRTGAIDLSGNGNGILVTGSGNLGAIQIGGPNPGDGNIIRNMNTIGILVNGAVTGFIQGNEVGGNGQGIELGSILGWDVLDNTIAANAFDGIRAFQPCPVALSCVISGNEVYGHGDSGMFLEEQASGYVISGNRVGIDGTNTASPNLNGIIIRSGSNQVGPGNTLSGNNGAGLILGTPRGTGNVVQSNFIGTAPDGESAIPNFLEGVRIMEGGNFNTIGGPGVMNVISGNRTHGVSIQGFPYDDGGVPVIANNNTVSDNHIGVNPAGDTALPNGETGVGGHGVEIVGGAYDNTVNGNVISSNLQDGVLLFLAGDGNSVTDNKIGTAVDGMTPLPNLWNGVDIVGDATGGHSTITGNTIANQPGSGVILKDIGGSPYVNATIQGNSIFSNERIGIDLTNTPNDVQFQGDLRNLNDATDGDVGPNGMQNYPALTSAKKLDDGTITLDYTLTPIGSDITVEVFNSDSDSQEGQTLVASATTSAGSIVSGQSIRLQFDGTGLILGDRLVATATADGKTSEFSLPLTVMDAIPRGFTALTVLGDASPVASLTTVEAAPNGDFLVASGPTVTRHTLADVQSPVATVSGAVILDVIASATDVVLVYSTGAGGAVQKVGGTAVSVPDAAGGAIGPQGNLHIVAGTQILVGQGLDGPYTPLSLSLPAGVIEYLSVAFGPTGTAYVGAGTAAGGSIYRLNDAGQLESVWSLTTRPTSLDFSEDGRLYVTTPTQVLSGKPTQIAPTEFLALPGAGAADNSLAIGPNSRLFVAHQERGQVYRLSLPNSQDVEAALTFKMSDPARNMIAGMDAAVAAAFDTWRNLPGVGTNVSTQISYDPGPGAPNVAAIGDMENTIALSDDPLFLGRSTLGVASKLLRVGPSGNPEEAEVVTADILLNSRFHPVTGTSGELGKFTLGTSTKDHNVKNVVTHEVGHVIGLVHVGTPAGVMFYNLPKGEGTLTSDDKAAILRKASDGSLDNLYGTITGQVTSGRVTTFGTAVGGAMVIATHETTRQSVSAYTDRLGNFDLSYLPVGNYELGLFALDGSVFASKIPLTPGRISRTLDTIANERDFLEEYWNGINESANDDRNEKVIIAVSTGSSFTANFITNIDTAPPTVAYVTVGENPDAASLDPKISLTFSERVLESSAASSGTLRRADCAVPCATAVPLSVVLSKTGRKVAIATPPASLAPGTAYVVSIEGLVDDAGNVQAVPFSSVFTTRPADFDAPSVLTATPASGAVEVSTASLLTVRFSEAMSSASLTGTGGPLDNVTLREVLGAGSYGPALAGKVSIPASDVVAFSPSLRLDAGATYELLLTDVADVSGNVMPQQSIEFTTANDAASMPVVVDFGPSDGASGISRETQVFIDFSEAILEPVTGAAYPLELKQGGTVVGGEFSLLNDGTRLVFTPGANLQSSTAYSIVVSAGMTDLSLNPVDFDPLAGGVQSTQITSFTTGSEALAVTLISPSTGSIGSIVTIEGTGFNAGAANTVVFTGGGFAEVLASTVSSVTVVVPEGTTSGPVSVSGVGGVDFTLYVAPETFDTAITRADTGDAPSDVDVNPDGTLAVVTNSKSDTVSIIDVDTGQEYVVVVGDTPLRVVLTPDGERAYVTNYNSHSVSVINLACAIGTGDPGCIAVDSIPVGFNPIGIDVAPDGSRVYVANYTSQSISVIDAIETSGSYNRAVRTIETDEAVTEVFTDPDGGVRYLDSEAGNSSTDPNPDGTLEKLRADANPSDVNASPDGSTIYIGVDFGVIVSEVDLEREQADWGVTVLISDTHPSASDLNPDGGVTKIITDGAGTATNTDPDGAGTIAKTSSTVSDVESSPDGAIVSMVLGSGELVLYAVPDAPFTGEYQAVTTTGSDAAASEVATSPDGSLYYVTSYETSTVSIYEFGVGLSSEESDPFQVSGSGYGFVLRDVIQVGLQPQGLAYSPERNIAIVANTGSDDVTILSFDEVVGVVLEQEDEVDPDLNQDGIPDIRVAVADELAGLEGLSSGEDQEDYSKALEHAAKNLDDKVWTDALPSGKHGRKVFDNDRQVVKALERVIDRDGFGNDVATYLLQLVIDLDRTIVVDAIDKAQADIDARVCASGKLGKKCRKQVESAEKELAKAVNELADADAEIADGDFDKAIDHLKKAWEHATKSQDDAAGKGFWEIEEDLPVEFALSQNYPNPFNPVTTVEFALPETVEVRLEVFDVLGRRVQTLVNGPMDAGYHSVQFNAERLASGIYIYRIQAGAYSKVQRMVLMK